MTARFSSHRQRLDRSFLSERLSRPRRYDRIAGSFSSSILEVAVEAPESVQGPVRLMCDSALNPGDVLAAKKAARRRYGGRGANPGQPLPGIERLATPPL